MNSIIQVFCINLTFVFQLVSDTANIDLVRSIGNDSEEYTFFEIRDIVTSNIDESIFIVDIKGHFVAKYTSDGKFVKRIGRVGQGPGDFNSPTNIDCTNQFVYVHDMSNQRIVKLDHELNFIKTYT